MTNKAIKHAQYNLMMNKSLETDIKNVCECALAIVKVGASKKEASHFAFAYSDEYLPVWNKKDIESREYDLRKRLAAMGVDYEELVEFVEVKVDLPGAVANDPKTKRMALEGFAENIAIMLIILNDKLGYSDIRLHRTLDYMREYDGNAVEEAKMKLNISFEGVGDGILRNYRRGSRGIDKVSRSDARRMAKGMQALKAMQAGKGA